MNPKRALTNGTFCPMPWKGLMYNFDGMVKNCIRSAGFIGDLKTDNINDILQSETNINTQRCMLKDAQGPDCHTCYELEGGKRDLDIISDRIFYIRELKKEPFDSYTLGNHDLRAIDVRWSNLCNFSCIYCNSEFSSRWAKELNEYREQPSSEQLEDFKNYVFENAKDLKHVYMAGGEPLLMKQNLELLTLLKEVNPGVNLRINTNLSKTDTRVFDTICEFENVHWTLSIESMEDEFEYIRHGGKWQDFVDNLTDLEHTNHKISFNMLYFLLNYNSLFDTVEYLQGRGFHNNSFIIGALLGPLYLNIRHLPDSVLESIKNDLQLRIDKRPGYLLEDGYKNILRYVQQPFDKNLESSIIRLRELDLRRNLDSRKVFPEIYKMANYIHLNENTNLNYNGTNNDY